MEKLRVAALQLQVQWHNPAANRSRIVELFSHFDSSADLILLPEMFTTGFSMAASELAETMDGETVIWMKDFARERNALVGGSIIIRENGQFYNRFVLVNEKDIVFTYDKRHLFRMSGEHETYIQGQTQGFCQIKGWKVAIQICYDLRFPVWSRNRKNEAGFDYDLLINVASWPAVRIRHWDTLLKARAIDNQAYVIGLNRVGEDGGGVNHVGSSAILDPLGDPLAHHVGDETILYAELDYEQMATYREKFPIWKDADEFSLK